jgi:hypothetical protein
MLDADLIRTQMFGLGVNVAQLAEISGVAPNKLSQFVNGTRGIRNDEIARLRNSLADLEQLIAAAQPFPLAFKNTGRIRELILSLKRGELSRIVSPDAPKVV